MSSAPTPRLHIVPGSVYSVWSDFWASRNSLTPGLHFWKATLSGGAVFIAPVGLSEVSAFVETQAKNSAFYFINQGTALIDEIRWLGHWCAFSAEPKPVQSNRAVPTAPGRAGEVKGWF